MRQRGSTRDTCNQRMSDIVAWLIKNADNPLPDKMTAQVFKCSAQYVGQIRILQGLACTRPQGKKCNEKSVKKMRRGFLSYYEKGESDKSIADRFGIYSEKVGQYRRSLGLPKKALESIRQRKILTTKYEKTAAFARLRRWPSWLRVAEVWFLDVLADPAHNEGMTIVEISVQTPFCANYLTKAANRLISLDLVHYDREHQNSPRKYHFGAKAMEILEERARVEHPEEYARLQELLECPKIQS